jgi:hypothetical protein
MFSQTLVVPLFHRYGILTQVAADNVNVIKLLAAAHRRRAEIDLLRRRARRTPHEAERKWSLARRVRLTMTKGIALRRSPTSKRAAATVSFEAS